MPVAVVSAALRERDRARRRARRVSRRCFSLVSRRRRVNGKPDPECVPDLAAELPRRLACGAPRVRGHRRRRRVGEGRRARVVGLTRTLGAERLAAADDSSNGSTSRAGVRCARDRAPRRLWPSCPRTRSPHSSGRSRSAPTSSSSTSTPTNGSRGHARRAAPRRRYPTLAEVVDLCRGRIGLMVELKRRRVGDTVSAYAAAARRRDVLLCFQRRAARGGARAATRDPHDAARRLRGLDPTRRWRLGGRLPERPCDPTRAAAAQRARPRDGGLHGERRPARMLELADARRRRRLYGPPGSSAGDPSRAASSRRG